LAIEYPFWQERFPEALCRFGLRIPYFPSPGTPGEGQGEGSTSGTPSNLMSQPEAAPPPLKASKETGGIGDCKMKNENFKLEGGEGRLPPSSLAFALQSCQDALAAEAIAQDPTKFQTLIGGRAGVSVVYDLWRRARAAATGSPFSAEHGGPAE
jgi:hypothetical protein